MQKQNDIYGFYHVEDEITVGAFRAYLDAPASSVKAFHLGDGATSIQEIVNSKSSNGKWFNLAGQRVQEIQKGVNITNGKKVILK